MHPELNLVKISHRNKKNIEKLINIERLSLSILTKLSKEVNEISKFFKKNNLTHGNKKTRNSYA